MRRAAAMPSETAVTARRATKRPTMRPSLPSVTVLTAAENPAGVLPEPCGSCPVELGAPKRGDVATSRSVFASLPAAALRLAGRTMAPPPDVPGGEPVPPVPGPEPVPCEPPAEGTCSVYWS